jgi:hypothetical protein
MSSELDRDMLSWLKSNSIDNQADYLSRGRRYSGLEEGLLLEEWKKSFRAMTSQPDAPVRGRRLCRHSGAAEGRTR